ncbi:MAG: hypothetical protein PHE20_03275 [Patescibacteria group bacterium]|jgi:hypothetical protein|nr:hypothetical protein [Patescibacteria group bacterium]
MEAQTKKSSDITRWVLNRIQTERALDSRSGKNVITFSYGNKKNEPTASEQYHELEKLSDCGAIRVIKEAFENIISLKTGKRIKVVEDAPIVMLSKKTIFPSQAIIEIKEKKFFELLVKHNIIADKEKIKYTFNPDIPEGSFTVGEKTIQFRGRVSAIIQYFYENKSKLSINSDFEDFIKYLSSHDNIVIQNLKSPDNKIFRDGIKEINERIKKEFININTIIGKTNKEKTTGRNTYQWRIEFDSI